MTSRYSSSSQEEDTNSSNDNDDQGTSSNDDDQGTSSNDDVSQNEKSDRIQHCRNMIHKYKTELHQLTGSSPGSFSDSDSDSDPKYELSDLHRLIINKCKLYPSEWEQDRSYAIIWASDERRAKKLLARLNLPRQLTAESFGRIIVDLDYMAHFTKKEKRLLAHFHCKFKRCELDYY